MIGTGAFWQTLAKRIRERRKNTVESLAKGTAGSMPEVMRMVGETASLDWVLGQAADILGEAGHPIPNIQTADIEDEF